MQEPVIIRGDSPMLSITGRHVIDHQMGTRSFDFPGVSVALRMNASTSVKALLNNSGVSNRFAVSLDGGLSWLKKTINATKGENEYVLCSNLSPTRAYDIMLLKLTEACSHTYGCGWGDFGTATLSGFLLDQGANALAPLATTPLRTDGTKDLVESPWASHPRDVPRPLEFIGDSITASWAAHASRAASDDDSCSDGEDVRASWAHLTAQTVGAQPHIIAWGGIGLVQNDDAGTRPDGASAPALWHRALANNPHSSWDPTSWVPDAVLVHLGTNDLCCDHPVQSATFEARYVAFLEEMARARRLVQHRSSAGAERTLTPDSSRRAIRASKAAASKILPASCESGGTEAAGVARPAIFLLGCGPMGNSKGGCDHTGRCDYFPCAVIERVAAAANASGFAHALVLDFSGLMDADEEVGGCRHPSALAHERMARRAVGVLRAALGWQ